VGYINLIIYIPCLESNRVQITTLPFALFLVNKKKVIPDSCNQGKIHEFEKKKKEERKKGGKHTCTQIYKIIQDQKV